MTQPNPSKKSRGSGADSAGSINRRALLVGSGVAALGLVGYGMSRSMKGSRAASFLAANQSYTGDLEQTIHDGLIATGIVPAEMRGKRVLLKPNMVEPTREAPHMTTHPAVVVATAEVFRRWDATVLVGEAPGHVRDTELALEESGIGAALESAGLDFSDMNYEEFKQVKNLGGASQLAGFYFPRPVIEADLIVSLPKLKSHHWVGMTAATKNLYGTLPGIRYGWPKNVLHHAGIPQTVMDIYACLAAKTVTVIDGITCMEGDGPILGTPKEMGIIAVGTNLTAVDATCARIMQLDPEKITYLNLSAKHRLGPIRESRIEQRGEAWRKLSSRFDIVDAEHLNTLRVSNDVLVGCDRLA